MSELDHRSLGGGGWVSDAAIARLRALDDRPDFSATRYELLDEIGRGGMGIVFRGRDCELGREVAIKVTAWSTSADAERLRQEARTLAALEHPGIVPIHDVGQLAGGRVFVVMMLVRGERLDACAARLPLHDRLRLFDRVCDTVSFAHARGVIHRDLKPANIMIGPFGQVLVLDWGLARPGSDPGGPSEQTSGSDPGGQTRGAARTGHGRATWRRSRPAESWTRDRTCTHWARSWTAWRAIRDRDYCDRSDP